MHNGPQGIATFESYPRMFCARVEAEPVTLCSRRTSAGLGEGAGTVPEFFEIRLECSARP